MKTFNIFKWLLAILTFILLISIPTNCNAQTYKRSGNTFVSTTTSRSKVEPIKTEFTYKDSDNKDYIIYISSTGSCFIKKISKKSGKEYPKYLGPEISQEICKEMNITYKGKTTKVKNS